MLCVHRVSQQPYDMVTIIITHFTDGGTGVQLSTCKSHSQEVARRESKAANAVCSIIYRIALCRSRLINVTCCQELGAIDSSVALASVQVRSVKFAEGPQ